MHSSTPNRPKILPDLLQEAQNKVLKLATDLELVVIESERLKAENQQIKADLKQAMAELGKSEVHVLPAKTTDPAYSVKEQTLLSFNQPCTQSTTYSEGSHASNAVDGTLQKMSHTTISSNPTWWRVELPDGSTVEEVILVRRLEGAQGSMDRNCDFWVILQDENMNEVAKIFHPGKMDVALKKFRFFGVVAKYVEVRMERAEYMHWQQVLVYGQTNSNIQSSSCPSCVMDFAS